MLEPILFMIFIKTREEIKSRHSISNSIEYMVSYILQAVSGWGCWRQESKRSGRGRSRRRRIVENEVLKVSNQNRCGVCYSE